MRGQLGRGDTRLRGRRHDHQPRSRCWRLGRGRRRRGKESLKFPDWLAAGLVTVAGVTVQASGRFLIDGALAGELGNLLYPARVGWRWPGFHVTARLTEEDGVGDGLSENMIIRIRSDDGYCFHSQT